MTDPQSSWCPQRFAAALLDPDIALTNMALSTGNGGIAVDEPFAVYRNNTIVQWVDALAATFPAIVSLLGQEYFRAVAAMYARRQPPTQPVLQEYGRHFPAVLRDFAPLAEYPYLADVATLELLRRETFHAADAEVLTLHQVRQKPMQVLLLARFKVHPALRWLRSEHPVLTLWRSQVQGESAPKIEQWQAQSVLVSRPGWEVLQEVFEDDSLMLLEALQAELPLAAAIQLCGADLAQMASRFAALVKAGAFSAFTQENNS